MSSHAPLPDRRQFLAALSVAFVSRRLPWAGATGALALKSLAEYQAEGAAYSSALNALSVNATSLSAHTALAARVGGDLTKRLSRIVAEAAQDARVVAGMKPILASAAAFAAFSKAVAADGRAALNVPGLQAAISDAMSREARLRGSVLAKQSAFAALIRQQAANVKDSSRLAELAEVERKIAQSQEVAAIAASVAIIVAIALIVVAVVVALFTFGAGAAIVTTAVTAAAVVAGITASAVIPFAQEAAQQADAAQRAAQDCLDAAWSRRKSCRQAVTTSFPPQREYEQGLCEAKYLADILRCAT